MTTIQTFAELALAEPIQRALREKNYTHPSPIQARAIPPLLEGSDLLGAAQTGTGKTAAFALPLIDQMHAQSRRPQKNRPRALILTPTRELAVQVAQSFKDYGRYTKITATLVYGGVSAFPQIRALNRGVDVLVATPGRLLDLHEQGHIDFSQIEYFVLDEADRMLDMGFIRDIRKIVALLPDRRQSLFFSATLSPEISSLAGDILENPVEVRIAPQKTTAEKVEHRICFLHQEDRMNLLNDLLQEQNKNQERSLTLVFSRTKHGAERLAKTLNRTGVRADAIHGNKTQAARQRALDQFKSGQLCVLVATDVAARGIDVKDITLVVNYDLPDEPEAYVHRIGRTARGGASGQAISFCTQETTRQLREIEKLIAHPIAIFSDHAYHHNALVEQYTRKARSNKPPTEKKAGRQPHSAHPRKKRFRARSSRTRRYSLRPS